MSNSLPHALLTLDPEPARTLVGSYPRNHLITSSVRGPISFDVVVAIGLLQLGDADKCTAQDAHSRELGEEGSMRVRPPGAGRLEVAVETRMLRQPSRHLGRFVGSIVVEHEMLASLLHPAVNAVNLKLRIVCLLFEAHDTTQIWRGSRLLRKLSMALTWMNRVFDSGIAPPLHPIDADERRPMFKH